MSDVDELTAAIGRHDHLASVRILRAIAPFTPVADLVRAFSESFDEDSILSVADTRDDGEALYRLGVEFWQSTGQELVAIDVFRLAVEMGSRQALEVVGDALDWLGAYEAAVPYLERARDEGVGQASRIAGLLGHARRGAGESGVEVEGLLREGASEHAEFGVDLAVVLRARGDIDELVPLLRDLVAKGVPGSPIMLGNVLDDVGDPGGAIEAYEAGIAQGDAHSAYNLAILHRHRGAPDLAAAFLAVAREMGDLSAWPDDSGQPEGE